MKEKWNFIPNKKDRWSEPKEKLISPERRNFLGALAGFGATALASGAGLKYLESMANVPSTPEKIPVRERILDGVVRMIRQNIRSPRLQGSLEGKGPDALKNVLQAIEFPILPEHLQGTTYDADPLVQKYQAQIALMPEKELGLAERVAIQSSTAFGDKNDYLAPTEFSYGNGVYVERHLVLTAGHVVGMLLNKEEFLTKEIDVGLLQVGRRLSATEKQHLIAVDNPLTNKELHGSFVAIAGIDPDSTSEKSGRKVYPGIAVKLSQALAKQILRSQGRNKLEDVAILRRLSRSFMVILPPGEAKFDDKASFPAKGMSGATVYAKGEKGFIFGGIFWGALQINIGNKSVDIGFFHGVDEVREALREIKVEKIPEK